MVSVVINKADIGVAKKHGWDIWTLKQVLDDFRGFNRRVK